MDRKTRRVNLSISEEKYQLLKELSEQQGQSMASLVEEFMDVGMELFEDIGLAEMAEERMVEKPDEWLTIEEL